MRASDYLISTLFALGLAYAVVGTAQSKIADAFNSSAARIAAASEAR